MTSSYFFNIGLIMLIGIMILIPAQSYAETIGSIAVTLIYTNGDMADYYSVSLKVYQDFNTVPYKEIESLTGNPFNIVSLPVGHHYKIEAYANSMYATVAYVDLQQAHQDVTIKLPLPGGIRINVFYNDGLTPISNSTVYVRSQDNKTWAHGITDINGKSMRFWIGPTTLENDHYIVDVKIGEHLLYSDLPIFLRPGIPQEIKVTTNWPPVVNNLVTVRVLDEKQNPLVTKDKYVVDMWNNGNKMTESVLTARGEAYFSNIKVGEYQFKAIKLSDSSEWGNLNATIDGTKTIFIISKSQQSQVTSQTPSQVTSQTPSQVTSQTPSQVTSQGTPQVMPQISPQVPPQVPSQISPQVMPLLTMNNCKCVAFRLDNVQDYWLDNVQSDIIDTFDQKNASITLGIIGSVFGSDSKLVGDIKTKAQRGNLDIAMNGWNFEDFTTFNQQQQKQLLEQSKSKIISSLGVTPSVFIPPYGKVNNNTFFAMADSGINLLSTVPNVIPSTNLANIHYLPAKVNAAYSSIQNRTNDAILLDIKNAINKDGFAIVTLSFQDYAQNNGTTKINIPDIQEMQNLQSLIDSIKNNDYNIVTVKDIVNTPSVPEFGSTIGVTITIAIISVLVISRKFSLSI